MNRRSRSSRARTRPSFEAACATGEGIDVDRQGGAGLLLVPAHRGDPTSWEDRDLRIGAMPVPVSRDLLSDIALLVDHHRERPGVDDLVRDQRALLQEPRPPPG